MSILLENINNSKILNDETNKEILGSVTHETPTNDKSIQLRSSARVSKKLKLVSRNTISLISSERKEVKLDEKISEQKSNARRVHELWSTEDKNAFFEALNEYGKDFDAIQTHMNNKRKKRGINHIISKNRDQARHFYYRTWHKISKYLKFPQEVKKVVREQYGLINFGEFRKKVGFVSEKNSVKLNELIYSGNTQVRVKGKTIRIKTPVCRALRKLNQLQETSADIKLPTRILIELRPRNNKSWSHVQSLAMNPRVRTTLPLQQLLLSLIIHLQQKWHLPDTEINETSPFVISSENNSVQLFEEGKKINSVLRLAPKQGVSIIPLSIRTGEFITSSNISLMAYEEKFGLQKSCFPENARFTQIVNKGGKTNRIYKKQIADDEKYKISSDCESFSQNHIYNDGIFTEMDFVSSTVNQLLSLKNNIDISGKYGNEESDCNSPNKEDFELEMTLSENKEEIIERAKAGWTVKNADLIRIGDLYLMFGAESKLQLDYWWDDENDERNSITEEIRASHLHIKKNGLTQSLNKLISLAKLYPNKDKDHCLCGHICKSSGKFINNRGRVLNKTKNFSLSHIAESEKIVTTTFSETPVSKNYVVLNVIPSTSKTNSISSNSIPRTISSFKEQLDLQYYNRRRSGDKQRTLPSLPKVTIQVIKAKEDHVTDVISAANEINSTLLIQDDDSKSSCSTITRFLKQALPEVIPQTSNSSPNGLCTPVISRSSNRIISDSSDNVSNFSGSNLLTQFDIPTKYMTAQTEEETRFSADVETQFQRLINESSVDYTEKFANLAAQIASETLNPKI